MSFISPVIILQRSFRSPYISKTFQGFQQLTHLRTSGQGVMDHSPTRSAEVKNEWSYTYAHPVRFQGMARDTFTFTFYVQQSAEDTSLNTIWSLTKAITVSVRVRGLNTRKVPKWWREDYDEANLSK
jgi:hypothetical protein